MKDKKNKIEAVIPHIQNAGILSLYAKNMLDDFPFIKYHLDIVCRSLASIQVELETLLKALSIEKERHAK